MSEHKEDWTLEPRKGTEVIAAGDAGAGAAAGGAGAGAAAAGAAAGAAGAAAGAAGAAAGAAAGGAGGAGGAGDTDESGFEPRKGLKLSIPKTETKISRCIQDVNYTDYITIEKQIGEGSFGKVFSGTPTDKFISEYGKIYHINKTSKISVKWIKYKPDNINTIKAELEILSQLNNPNVIKYYFCINYSRNNHLFIFMEYFEGKELFNLLEYIFNSKENNQIININYKTILNIYEKIMNGVSYLHSNKIYHRDLKPENIMINYDLTQIKIIDFGLSCFYKEDSFVGNCTTPNGTPKYLSPILIKKVKDSRELKKLYMIGKILDEPIIEELNNKQITIHDYWAIILILFDLLSVFTYYTKKLDKLPYIFESFNIYKRQKYYIKDYIKNINIISELNEEGFNIIFDENPDNYFNIIKNNLYIILQNPYKTDLIIEQYNYIKSKVNELIKEIEEHHFTTPTTPTRPTTTPHIPIKAARRNRHLSSQEFNPEENPLLTPPRKIKRSRKGDNKYYLKYIKYKKKYLMLKHKL